jgi:glycosyltransferase involved in cell wall biosynthesis
MSFINPPKVIYIQQHIKASGYHPPLEMYPNYFTYGFGGRMGRMFRKYNPLWDVEVWRLDSTANKVIETDFEEVHFKIFPARGNSKFGIYSFSFIRALRQLPRNTILNVQNIHNPLLYQILLFSPSHLIITAQHHGDYHPYFVLKNFKGFKRIKALIGYVFEKSFINRVSHFFIIDVDHIDYLKTTVKSLDDKFSIQPVGIDFSMYKRIPKEEACSVIGLDPNKKHLFYLGQYYHIKEVDRLCEVYKKVKEKNPEIQLFVAGGSAQDPYYSNLIQCGAIDFGKIPNNELYKYYSAADVYVCLTFREDYFGGIGLAMLESMACGTPVVSKSLENIPENIRQFVGKMPSGENEMIKDINNILNTKQNYSDCRKYVEGLYDYSVIQKNTAEIYSNLLQNKNK